MFLAVIIIFSGSLLAENTFRVGVNAGYMFPSNDDLKEIYGNGNLIYGLTASYMFTGNIELSATADFYSSDSDEDILGRKSTLWNNYFRLGVFYNFNPEKLNPRLGAGVELSTTEEESAFGTFDDSSTGWFVSAGIQTHLGKALIAGLDVIYDSVKFDGNLGSEELGGVSILCSLLFSL